MDNNTLFDPMAWAAASDDNKKSASDQHNADHVSIPQSSVAISDNELAKAQATADELIRLGGNIAELYDDWFRLGCSIADGLGPEGRDLFHLVSSQSTKYCEADCEKQWQECLKKHDGRATIATFYKMAQQAGVDLSAISRRFPSLPSNPHVDESGIRGNGLAADHSEESIIRTNVLDNNPSSTLPVMTKNLSCEGSEGSEGNASWDTSAETMQYTETFSDKLVISELPSLLQDSVATQSDDEGRDKVLLTSLTLFSGAMPGIFGIYDGKRVYPPFYTLIDAPSGADKGILSDCRQLVIPIEWEIRKKYEQKLEDYQQEHAQWEALDRKQRAQQQEPQKPNYRSAFIPANSSATSAYQALADNDDWGIIFETEADTLAQALRQDYGNYSDGLRKAFHHERISYGRRKDDEHVNVECPRLATLLTCTPGQIPELLSPQQVENGLANRFLFYNLRSHHVWRNVFAQSDEPISDKLNKVGQRYLNLYHDLQKRASNPLQFVLSVEQQQEFNHYFSGLLLEQIGLNGEKLDAFVKRLGLSTFRLAMVLTVLRCEERQPKLDPLSQTLVCSDHDFRTAKTIADCLINHTAHVYANLLPHDEQPVTSGRQQLSAQELALYRTLPDEFTTKCCQQTAQQLNIPWKTAERYVGQFVNKHHIAVRIRNGQYRKV